MSIFGQPPGQGSSVTASPAGVYGRGDLQAAFNWLVNQPEHIRKQASDPDRLMTLFYRSSGRPEMVRTTEVTRTSEAARTMESTRETARIETEAPVSGQAFISDLRQINEALRQFDGPGAQATIHTSHSQTAHASTHVTPPTAPLHTPLQPPLTQAPLPQPLQQPQHSPHAHYPAPHQHPMPQYLAPQPPMAPSHMAPSHYGQPNYAASTGKMQHMINEVREKLNLSSDAEALNMLVTLGYRNLKPLLD